MSSALKGVNIDSTDAGRSIELWEHLVQGIPEQSTWQTTICKIIHKILEKPEIDKELQVVLDAAPLGPDHALVRERIGQYDTHIPIFPGCTRGQSSSITDRSYFGAVLMALFDLSPFLNFIEEAATSKAFNDPIFVGLHALAQFFHRRGDDRLVEDELVQEVGSRTETLWNCIKAEREGPNDPEMFPENFCHVHQLINYLFKRLEHAQLRQGAAGSRDDVNISTRFKQLFKHSTSRLTHTRCNCAEPVLRRQPPCDALTYGYILTVVITEGMHLEQAISRAMWEEETKSSPRTCPKCGEGVHASHFNTFAYLPEVFFISLYFMSERDEDEYVRYTPDEKFVYPERLGMSGLRDDLKRPGDQNGDVYKLQSIITCENQNMDAWTRYKPALRVSENEWVQYGYGGQYESTTTFVTFEEINDPSNRAGEEAPHILMYVRDRHAKGFDALPDAVKHRSFPPEPNTVIHDKHGRDSSDLERFVEAQKQPGENGNATAFESAKSELGQGHKTSHWIWFIFPQVSAQRASRLSNLYAIKSLGEAIAYWNHPELKRRYIDLLHIVLKSSQTDLEKLFGSGVDAAKFEASLTLFALTCNDKERDIFEQIFKKFDRQMDYHTVWQLYEWLHEAGEDKAIMWMQHYVKIPDHRGCGNDGEQKIKVPERGGLSILVTSPKALAYNIPLKDVEKAQPSPANGDGSGTDAASIVGKNLYLELMKLTETDFDASDGGLAGERAAVYHDRAVRFGKVILGYAAPKGTVAPAETPEFLEKARRLGGNLMLLSRPPFEESSEATSEAHNDLGKQVDGAFDYDHDSPADELALDEDFEPDDGLLPDDGHETGDFRTTADDFGLDGSSDELAEGAYSGEENPYEAVAIPTDPNDPRIEACQAWTLDDLKSEFQKEQLDLRGLRNDDKKHRIKFLKHFELERDYSIYHESRLRQAVKEKGIVMSNGVNRADKAELVDALTEYDTQRLGEMEFAEGEDTEQTDSVEFEPEEYQSSEAPETDRSSASEETSRPKKRPRDQYEEEEDDDDIIDDEDRDVDYGDEDYNDEDGDTETRGPPKGPVRIRTRY